MIAQLSAGSGVVQFELRKLAASEGVFQGLLRSGQLRLRDGQKPVLDDPSTST
jgi:hypothetical protein